MNQSYDIIPLCDQDLLNLAQRASGGSGLFKCKNLFNFSARNLDLSDVKVIDSIAKYLVTAPIAESDRLISEIDEDIKRCDKFKTSLFHVQCRFNGFIVNEILEDIIKSISWEIKHYCCSDDDNIYSLTHRHHAYSRYQEEYHYKDFSLDKLSHMVRSEVGDFIRDSKKLKHERLEYACRLEAKRLIEKYIAAFLFYRKLSSVDIKSIENSFLAEMYKNNLDDIILIRAQLEEHVEILKAQRKVIVDSIEPVKKLSNDLRSYLDLSSSMNEIISSIEFINDLESKMSGRNYAISMLSHYSNAAVSALTDVKSTLSSYQSAKMEIDRMCLKLDVMK